MKTVPTQAYKFFIMFFIGGLIYGLIEILWRGNTHWTMLIVGGLCFILIGGVNEFFTYKMSLISQMLISAIMITIVEYVSGIVINVVFGLNVWDYSTMPYNLHGQICLLYFCLWFLLSVIGIILDDFLRWKLFKEEKPKYKIL